MKIPLFMGTIRPTPMIRALLSKNSDEVITIDTADTNDLYLIMELGKWSNGVSEKCKEILQQRRLEYESRKQ